MQHTPLLLFLGDLGGGEIMLILVVILIFFGAKRIPELARGLGQGLREFKDASSEIRQQLETADLPQRQPVSVQQQPIADSVAQPHIQPSDGITGSQS